MLYHSVNKIKGLKYETNEPAQEVVDGITTKQGERYTSRSRWKMNQSTRESSHKTSDIVAYHKAKHKFLSLTDMEKEDPDKLQICQFRGQDFELIED